MSVYAWFVCDGKGVCVCVCEMGRGMCECICVLSVCVMGRGTCVCVYVCLFFTISEFKLFT